MGLKIWGLLLGGSVLVVLAVAGLVFFRAEADGDTAVNRRLPPTVGSVIPDFELAGIDGKYQSLSSYRGKRLVINFWATWCPPCKEEMPLLEEYSKKHAGKLVILGVDSEETAETVKPFVTDLGITFPILLDQAGLVSDRYFVKDFPYTFFVDESGILRGQHIGLLTEARLVSYLKTLGIEP